MSFVKCDEFLKSNSIHSIAKQALNFSDDGQTKNEIGFLNDCFTFTKEKQIELKTVCGNAFLGWFEIYFNWTVFQQNNLHRVVVNN